MRDAHLDTPSHWQKAAQQMDGQPHGQAATDSQTVTDRQADKQDRQTG